VAGAVALIAFAFYLITLKPATSPTGANQLAGSDERRPGPASPGDPVQGGFSQHSAKSRIERENGSSAHNDFSGQAKPFYDFSGIKTIDPDSPSTTPTPEDSSEPKEEAKEESKAPLPVVFRSVDPTLLKIAPEQQKIIDDLKQSFSDMIGSAPQDPNDPNYLQRWEEAQWLVDQQLKAQLGGEFFLRYETSATMRTKR